MLRTPYAIPVGFLLLVAGFTVGYLLGSEPVRLGLMTVSGALAALAMAVGVRVHKLPDHRPWLLTVLAVALLTCGNIAWFVYGSVPGLGTTPPEWMTVLPNTLGYLLFLAASLMIVLRHTPRDASGTVDAAIAGIAIATPIWEFAFRPNLLAADTTISRQLFVLIQVLVLFGVCGALLRVTRTIGDGKACLWFLFGALGCTVAAIGTVTMVSSLTGAQASLSALFFAIGYLCLGAAGLHPSALQLMNPPVRATGRTPKLQLGMFGAAMLMIPVVGGIGQLLGSPTDGLLLTIAPILTVPLVLIRISRLSAQRTRDQRALAHQAGHDELTGLVNRRRLFVLMERAIGRHADGLGGDLALIYCDLNEFKPINDVFGHEAGDAVLRSTARRITETARSGDVVARLGGDEFLIFCPDADRDTAYTLSARIERAVAEPIPWRGETLRVSAALGTTLWAERRTVLPDDLLAEADARMYADKRARKSLSA